MAMEPTKNNPDILINQQGTTAAEVTTQAATQTSQTEAINFNSGAVIATNVDDYNSTTVTGDQAAKTDPNKAKETSEIERTLILLVSQLINNIAQLTEDDSSTELITTFQNNYQDIQKMAGVDSNINLDAIVQNALKSLSDDKKAKIEQVLGVKAEDGINYNYAPLNDFQANFFSKLPESIQKAAVQTSNAVNSVVSDPTIGKISATEKGIELANVASQTGKEMASKGWCLKGVNNTLEKVYGFRLSYESAYMATDALAAKTDLFTDKTSSYTKDTLSQLPAGAIVVWDRDGDSPHGHISIALGNGYESSDHINKQYTNISGTFHVFIPN